MFEGSERSAGGWRFAPVPVIVANVPELAATIGEIITDDARKGAGLFASVPPPPLEDEALDEYLGVDVYGMKCTLTPFLDALRRHGIIGGDNPLLSPAMTRGLFACLRHAAVFMKAHTDKPQAVKNEFSRIDGLLGHAPVWGLLLQILFADGLRCLLDGVQGEGEEEAASVQEWLALLLVDRLVAFTFTPYGNGDLARLAPMGGYLMQTELGRMVQGKMFAEPQPARALPPELQTDEAAAILEAATDAGLIGDGYEWRKGLRLAAWFASKASDRLKLGNGTNADGTARIAWKPFEVLFGFRPGSLREAMNDVKKIGQPPTDARLVDLLF